MDNRKVLPTVYSLYWPETRRVVNELWEDHNHHWYERAWENPDSRPDLEMLDTWEQWSGLDLKGFNYRYVTHGASEAIKDLIVKDDIAVFDGEYEGYAAFARARDLKVQKHLDGTIPDVKDMTPAFWLSEPSAIDGDHWGQWGTAVPGLRHWLFEMEERHPKTSIFLDAIYTGVVKKYRPTISPAQHQNVSAVVFSLSKPFGIYRHRIGGVFSRKPIPSLEGNRWFNNIFSVKLAQILMERYGVTEIPNHYAGLQKKVVEDLKSQGLLPASASPSNAILLATAGIRHSGARSDEVVPSAFLDAPFRRNPGNFRYCLTPALAEALDSGDCHPIPDWRSDSHV